jgi:uncharacterized membrane protein YraQ (UPF0718 family)
MYVLAGLLLAAAFAKDGQKAKKALWKAWKAFENILPLFSAIILIIGIGLAILSPEQISALMGEQSGLTGIVVAAVIGSVTLIPGFVTFPLAAALLKGGAGLTQVVVFISTSMMVGVVTLPAEIPCIGRKAAFVRNFLAFVFSFFVAFLLRGVLAA